MAQPTTLRRRVATCVILTAAAVAGLAALWALERAAAPLVAVAETMGLAAERAAMSQTALHLAGESRGEGPAAAFKRDALGEAIDALEAAQAALRARAPEASLSGARRDAWARLYAPRRGERGLDALMAEFILDARTVLDGGEPAASDAWARLAAIGPGYLRTTLAAVAELHHAEAAARARAMRRSAELGWAGAAISLIVLTVLALRNRKPEPPEATQARETNARKRIADLTKALAEAEWARRAAENRSALDGAPAAAGDVQAGAAQGAVLSDVRRALTGAIAMSEIGVAEATEAENDAARTQFAVIRSACETLLARLPDLVAVADGGEGAVAQPFSPTVVARRAQAAAAGAAQVAGVSLFLEPEPDLPGRCIGDAERFRAALVAVLGDLLGAGHGAALALTIAHRDGLLRYEVSDDGSGRSVEALQALAGGRSDPGGADSGLAAASRLAVSMGGRLDIAAGEDGGAMVAVEAPAAAVDDDGVRARRSAQGARVLVVDDSPINRQAAVLTLQRIGAETLEAEDGRAALELLETTGAVDLILMDMQMPRLDGLETIAALRGIDAHARTPILALTAEVSPSARRRCIDAGAQDYLPKPFDAEALQSHALMLLGADEAAPETPAWIDLDDIDAAGDGAEPAAPAAAPPDEAGEQSPEAADEPAFEPEELGDAGYAPFKLDLGGIGADADGPAAEDTDKREAS